MEAKYHKKQPINIKEEQKVLNSLPNPAKPLEKYFSKLQTVQKKLKDSKEPVKDFTLKYIEYGQLQKMPHLQ